VTSRFRSRFSLAGSVLAVAVSLGACSGATERTSPDPTEPGTTASTATTATARTTDRLEVVTQLVDDVVAPLLRSADGAVASARDAVAGYCADPEEDALDAARTAVDAAIDAYERLDPVDMGPITLNRTDSQVAYAVDAERVDDLLAAGPPVDVLTVNEMLPASTRGLLTAEHVLGAEADAGSLPAATCGFLVAITANAADEVAAVLTDSFDGSRGNPPYLNVLTGDANVAEEPQDTINVVVNMMMNVLDEDAGMLRDPAGTAPASVRRATIAHLATIAELWGDGTTGLSRLVDEDLASRLAAEIEATDRAVRDDTTTAVDAQITVDGLRATIGTEVVAALDVVVGFSDNDGDS
jgi:predicted lipoprotein